MAGLQVQAAGALSPGLTSTIRNVVGKMAANPQYWLSFSQTVGNGYENAIADMEVRNDIARLSGGKMMDSNSIRTKAALQAIGSGLMGAAVEMSGGLQRLPEELRHGEIVWKALVDRGIDEGKEEVFQGIIDRASQNLFYDKGNPLVSLTDPNAVFSLPAAANEFAEGFTVGNVLGGGQAGVLSAAQRMHTHPRIHVQRTADTPAWLAERENAYYTKMKEPYYGEKVHLRNSSERFGGAYSGGQVSAVEKSTKPTARGQAALRPADDEAASLTFGKAVSAASLGIDGGSKQETIHLLRGDETYYTAKAKRIASDRGLQLVLFAGDNLHITLASGTAVSVRGYISGNRAFVRADHPRYTSEQIMRHEAGHKMIAMGTIDLDEVRDYIAENSNVGKTAQLYMDAYAGAGMTADEIWEELICDSLGNMNIFSETLGEEVAQEYLMETRRAVEAVQRESVGSRAPPVDGKMSRDRLIDGNFPPYNESQSDANERATRWAHSDDVQTGDQKIASYHGRWYLIEAFDDADLGYRIVERLNKSQYNALVKEMQKHDNVPGVQKGFDRIVELDKG